ncbi:TPA: hypothetical protein ACMEWF_005842, partial [Klebsiella variicola subsp. variicola]
FLHERSQVPDVTIYRIYPPYEVFGLESSQIQSAKYLKITSLVAAVSLEPQEIPEAPLFIIIPVVANYLPRPLAGS